MFVAFCCHHSVHKPVDCKALFADYLQTLTTHQPVFPPPKYLPAGQEDVFLLQGYTNLSEWYLEQASHAPSAEVPRWSAATLQQFIDLANKRQAMGAYGSDAFQVFQSLDCHSVKGLNGAVFGSETPWLEGILFAYGAQHITTVEFRKTITEAPNHQVIRPLEWVKGLQDGSVPNVDFVFSFSSWEHDGLGRYGDPVDPWGDIKAMQRASCYVKPGGLLFLGLPSSDVDKVYYNAHRVYGPVRWPLMTANWHVVGIYDNIYKVGQCGQITCQDLLVRWQKMPDTPELQPVAVMRNTRTSPCML